MLIASFGLNGVEVVVVGALLNVANFRVQPGDYGVIALLLLLFLHRDWVSLVDQQFDQSIIDEQKISSLTLEIGTYLLMNCQVNCYDN